MNVIMKKAGILTWFLLFERVRSGDRTDDDDENPITLFDLVAAQMN
jgi:hypothetical protein